MNTEEIDKVIGMITSAVYKGYDIEINIYSTNSMIDKDNYFDFNKTSSNPEWSKEYFEEWASVLISCASGYVTYLEEDIKIFGSTKSGVFLKRMKRDIERALEFIQDKAFIVFDAINPEGKRYIRYKLYNTDKGNING